VQPRPVVLLILTLALASAACTGGGARADSPKGDAPVTVRAVSAVTADVPLEISAIGNVEAVSTVDIKSRVTAPVLSVHFGEGQDVHRGELLFDLDPEVYNRQIAEIEANIARDVANQQQAEANITKDQATLRNAQSIAERGRQLSSAGIFSREQTEQVTSNAESANATLEADRAGVGSAKAAEQADRARLEQIKLQLGYTKIYAPIAGRAGAILIKPGNLAKENDTPLVTILQISPIYVSFSIPEDLLPQVRQYGASHPLAVTAIGADKVTSEGQLGFIDSSVDTTTGTIKLKATFDNARRVLWPGQFANVRARLSLEHNRVLVPARTVQTGPQGKYVWIVNSADSTASMRNIQVLRTYVAPDQTEQAVVGSGLAAGEQVISEGQMRLAPGAHVRLLSANSAPTG
jgi:multidrug efflux system membrane fusion protein